MIKKINILLILIASIGSICFALIKQEELVLFLKDISIILTISALYIIQIIFKIKINDAINLVYILFIFMAHFLGVVVNLYDKLYWYDKFTHFLSGIVTSFGAVFILKRNNINKKPFFNILFILSLSMLVASCWEIFEFTASSLFNVDPQKVVLTGVNDTMVDIIVAFLGSSIVCFCYYFEYNNNHNLIIRRFEKLID